MRHRGGIALVVLCAVTACAGDSFAPAETVGGGGTDGTAGSAGASAGGTSAGGTSAGGSESGGAAGTGGSEVGGASTGGTAGAAGNTALGCPVLYLRSGASDATGNGCDPKNPLGTLGAALAMATASQQETDETKRVRAIQLCNGTYVEAEALTLTVPVSILGGYTCEDNEWVLPANASTEGYAADPPTVLQIAKPRGLLVQGGAIARSVTVSRVSIVPPVDALLSEPGIGIEVAQSASPTIELVKVVSQAGVSSEFGSAALVIRSSASPLVMSSVFQAGAGSIIAGSSSAVRPAAGSIGVFVGQQAGPTELRASVVRAGAGTTNLNNLASVGVFSYGQDVSVGASLVTAALGTTTMSSGAGDAPLTSASVAASGLGITPATLVITGSALRGGRGNGPTGASTTALFGSGVKVSLDEARLYGGDGDVATTDKDGAKRVTVASGALLVKSELTAKNSLFYGGATEPQTRLPTRFSRGVSLNETRFEGKHVTVGAGLGAGNDVGIVVIGTGSFALTSSLIVAERPTTWSLLADATACAGTTLKTSSTLDHVIFVQPETASGHTLFHSAATACGDLKTPSQLVQRGIVADETRVVVKALAPAGATDQIAVPACTTNALCVAALFPKWAPSAGSILQGAGFAPGCSSPLIAAGGSPVTPKDIAGVVRVDPTTPGAFQSPCP